MAKREIRKMAAEGREHRDLKIKGYGNKGENRTG